MFKKIRVIFIIIVFISIIGYGFIKVNLELPQFIKDRSKLKVSLTQSPFDLKLDMGDYIVYVNEKAFSNIKDGAVSAFKNIEEKTVKEINNLLNNKAK